MRCKICNGEASAFDTLDLSKNCNEVSGYSLPRSGIAVEYLRCEICEFIFTAYFDSFSAQDFCRTIYNDEYINIDPLYPEIRPKANAAFLSSVIDTCSLNAASILDYGAGNGKLAQFLNRSGTVNYDPLNPVFDSLPANKFDVIFSSETIEHSPFPHEWAKHWRSLLDLGGIILFSTMLQPDDIEIIRGSWWYIGPRNGHISIFSAKSLAQLLKTHGMHYEALSDEWHFACHRDATAIIDRMRLRTIVANLPTGFIPVP